MLKAFKRPSKPLLKGPVNSQHVRFEGYFYFWGGAERLAQEDSSSEHGEADKIPTVEAVPSDNEEFDDQQAGPLKGLIGKVSKGF